MADQPIPISGISDPEQIRVKLLASGRDVHAPMTEFTAASIHGAPTKATPVDADEFGYWDSVGLQAVKTTWANIKATLKTYFDTLYQPLAARLTSWAAIARAAGFDTFVAAPSSTNLRALLTDETGTGPAVFGIAPTLDGALFGANVGSGVTDLSRHISLYSTVYGFSITAASQNYVVPTSAVHNFAVNGATVAAFSATQLNLPTGQIAFPAAQIPSAGANDLDDYEEGTFTPAFAASGSTFSHSLQVGAYTKIGRMVFFDITLALNTSGNTLTANALTITGLPFAANASVGAGVFEIRWSFSTTSYVQMTGRVSGATIIVQGITAAATASGPQINASAALHATNGSDMRIIGSYWV